MKSSWRGWFTVDVVVAGVVVVGGVVLVVVDVVVVFGFVVVVVSGGTVAYWSGFEDKETKIYAFWVNISFDGIAYFKQKWNWGKTKKAAWKHGTLNGLKIMT